MMKGNRLKKVIAVILTVLIFFTSLNLKGIDAEAATYKLTYKKLSNYKLFHNKWNAKAKFGSGGGTTSVKNNVSAKLHYVNGEYAYCIYMPDSTDDGESKLFNPDNDSRTAWVNKKIGGYSRYAYCAIVEFYLVDKKISLDGISGSSKLLSLSKTERMLLSQAFVWYMEYAGWARKEGAYAMAIDNITGWSAAKQYVLFDELYTAVKNVLPKMKVSNQCYKLKIDGNSHQPVMVLNCEELPQYDKVTYSNFGEDSEKVTINVRKKDSETEKGLSGAQFEFVCDEEVIGTAITDSDGNISYVYNRMLKTDTYSSTKTYVTNWSNLSAENREMVTKNGYYQNKSKALLAAQAEVNRKVSAALQTLKSKTHDWIVTETKAPYGHSLPSDPFVIITEGIDKTLEYTFYDLQERRTLNLKKTSSQTDYGIDATLKDAEYSLYAADDIWGPDNKTIMYMKDSLVTVIHTDKEGKASVSALYPGKYYLRETQAPKGFELSDKKIEIDLTDEDQNVSVADELIAGKIKILKTYGAGQLPEGNARFEIYNSKDELVDAIVTDPSGTAESKELPYGMYRVHQTVGLEDYIFMADQNIMIDGSKEVFMIEENDELRYAGISIVKTTLKNDEETGTYEKKPESFAEFEIQTQSGKVVETIVTDENGVAKSGELSPGTYLIHQIKGNENFAFVEDFEVTLNEGEKVMKTFQLVDESLARKIRIKKTKSRNGSKTPESNAEFVIIDQSKAGDIKEKDLSSQEKRIAYVNSLGEDAIIGRIITDKNGEGAALLDKLPKDSEFFVLQTAGEKGYSLAEPYDSSENTPQKEGLLSVYVFTADDALDDWAKIKIRKKLVTERIGDDIETAPEEKAKFELWDSEGNVVEELTTGEEGEAISGMLDYGVYFLHQVDGADTHEFIKDQRIVLSEENRHQTVDYEFIDHEKEITFELTKKSSETEKLLNQATYDIYNEDENKVATIMTGLDGKDGVATCKLPYGKYTIKEAAAPEGFKPNKESEFILSFESVNYKDGEGWFSYYDEDEPVYGEIMITKTGDVLTGFYDNNFQYESSGISGAEYTLYARKDITLDDGTIIWSAGDAIDTRVTDKTGVIKFARKSGDGTTTTKFPLGEYYVKETKEPYGYVLDETEYDVILTWDNNAWNLNDRSDHNDSEESEETQTENRPEKSTAKYMLCTGEELNDYLTLNELPDRVIFTWKTAPEDKEILDVSSLEDGSVVMWRELSGDMTEVYISTQLAGQDIIFNALSSGMFKNLGYQSDEYKGISEICFDNVDTSEVIDMTEMFSGCDALVELDLSNFNTENVRFISRMFYNCANLVTVYAPDSNLIDWDDEGEKTMESISVKPKYEFLVGTEYEVDDFVFYINYSDGSSDEVTMEADEVEMDPKIAAPVGEQVVKFAFDSDGKYASFTSTETMVQVVEAPALEQNIKDIEYNLELVDELKTFVIRIKKTDLDGYPVEGAEFTLYAAATIVNAQGEVLFAQGDKIATALSELKEGDEAVVSFSGLPSDMYMQDHKEDGVMFTVKETKPALGYKDSDDFTLDFDANAEKYGNVTAIIHDYTEDVSKADSIFIEENTAYVYDSKVIENESQDYVVIHKNWDDYEDAANIRPVSIKVTVTLPDNDKKEYILSEENEWTVITDIPKNVIEDCKFAEELIDGYVSKGIMHPETGVYEFINTPEQPKKNIPVVKIWDDLNDKDGIRPESVTIELYRDDELYKEAVLNESNGWRYTWKELDAKNPVTKEEYVYEIKEAKFDHLTGDVKTGYRVRYERVAPSDENRYEYTTTVITNKHEPEKGKIKIYKIIDSEEISWDKWVPRFEFTLKGIVDNNHSYEEVKAITFTEEEVEVLKQESGSSMIKKEVVFEDLEDGTYTVTESGMEKYYELFHIESDSPGVTVNSDNVIFKVGEGNSGTGDMEASFVNNARKGSVKIRKSEDDGTPLKNVEFAIFDKAGNEVKRGTSDENGELLFENLKIGEYIVRETKTIEGKSLLAEPIKVSIPFVMTKEESREQNADMSKAVESENKYYFYDLTYHVTNSVTLSLPETGGLKKYGWLMSGLALIIIGVFCSNKKRKRRCKRKRGIIGEKEKKGQ
ncbi:MAG: SpaA isopeptide-forming pilin-related protein [Lachnospiraceae bacterium]